MAWAFFVVPSMIGAAQCYGGQKEGDWWNEPWGPLISEHCSVAVSTVGYGAMKYPFFNTNAWNGLQEVPGCVQRREINSVGNKNAKYCMVNIQRSGCGLCKQYGGAQASTCAYLSVHVCVRISSSWLSCSSRPNVGRCLWKASQKRKLSHVNISAIP